MLYNNNRRVFYFLYHLRNSIDCSYRESSYNKALVNLVKPKCWIT